MEEQAKYKTKRTEKTVADLIREDRIVWFKTSNLAINCGKVIKNYPNKKEAHIMNFDAWTDWVVSYNDIVRVGTNVFGDDYNNWMSKR